MVNELRYELRKVKEDNEWILKVQEELNTILLVKIHNEEKEKNKDFEQELPKTGPYNKRKGRKLEFSNHISDTSSEESVKHHIKTQESSESSDENKMKKSIDPMRKSLGSSKK